VGGHRLVRSFFSGPSNMTSVGTSRTKPVSRRCRADKFAMIDLEHQGGNAVPLPDVQLSINVSWELA
jgi:hypothetical protein